MVCDNKEGGTHHYACDCREAYFKQLEQAADRMAEELKRLKDIVGDEDFESIEIVVQAYQSLHVSKDNK